MKEVLLELLEAIVVILILALASYLLILYGIVDH